MNKFIIAWFVAPALSGLISMLVYFLLAKIILFHETSFRRGIYAIPFIYVLTISVNLILILYQILKKTCVDASSCAIYISVSAVTVAAVSVGTFFAARKIIVPFVKRKIFIKFSGSNSAAPGDPAQEELYLLSGDKNRMQQQTEQLFSFLQILSAVFTSFVHGSNDVSNSVGPLYGLYNAYQRSLGAPEITSSSGVTYGLLAYGGFGMVLGLYIWGSRVIETIGENLTVLSPSRGFSIEFGSAFTVLIASMMKLSVSTTHCKVGSIVCVGFFSNWLSKSDLLEKLETKTNTTSELGLKEREDEKISDEDLPDPNLLKPTEKTSINLKLILNIVASWICTIPFAGLLSALMYYCLILLCPEPSLI